LGEIATSRWAPALHPGQSAQPGHSAQPEEGPLDYSLIIPVYNEEGNVALLHQRLTAATAGMASLEIIFVDDGSSDGSFAILSQIAAADSRVKVIRFSRNFGKTAAMSAGFEASRGAIIVNMDADLQDDPEEIEAMLAKLQDGLDLVIGWRRERLDSIDKRWPSKFFNWTVTTFSGVQLHDFNCGFKVYRREVLRDLPLYSDLHRFLPLLAAGRGFKVGELPVRHHRRHAGVSKYGIGRTVRGLLDFVTVLFLNRYLTRPMHFFGSFGLLSIALSLATATWAVVLKLFFAHNFVNSPLPLLTVFLFLLGVVFILLGLIGEMLTRVYFETGGRLGYRVRDRVNL
jgi:glycosyltransferase involved in cell wall biosynthesis